VSSRPPVDAVRIEVFLKALGERFHGRGRLYLVDGTTLVYEGFRAQTLDIDLAYDLAAGEQGAFVTVVQQLKHELQVNVEEVSPADFIPLPAGAEGRARPIGRFGGLDVYHFDPYSTALSKIDRGRVGDFEDVLTLLRHGWLTWPLLEQRFGDILPAYEVASLKADRPAFERKFDTLREMWNDEKG
jgi:hypothetical protein